MRLRQCLSELEKYDRREKALTEQLAGYERVLSDYAREVEAGQVSVLDYLTVLRNKIQTERDATKHNLDMKATLSIHQLYAKPILFVAGLPLLLVGLPALMRRIYR